MQSKRLTSDGERTFVVVLDAGEEIVGTLLEFGREHRSEAASFTGLGALSDVTLGFFDLEKP